MPTQTRFAVAVSASCLAAMSVVAAADGDRLLITSVILQYAQAPQASTLLIRGSGFLSNEENATTRVYLGGATGELRQLEVIDITDRQIHARVDSVSTGTWRLIVSRAANVPVNGLAVDRDGRRDRRGTR